MTIYSIWLELFSFGLLAKEDYTIASSAKERLEKLRNTDE